MIISIQAGNAPEIHQVWSSEIKMGEGRTAAASQLTHWSVSVHLGKMP